MNETTVLKLFIIIIIIFIIILIIIIIIVIIIINVLAIRIILFWINLYFVSSLFLSDDGENLNALNNSGDIHDFVPGSDLDPSFLEGNEKRKKWWSRKEAKKVPDPAVQSISEDERSAIGLNFNIPECFKVGA